MMMIGTVFIARSGNCSDRAEEELVCVCLSGCRTRYENFMACRTFPSRSLESCVVCFTGAELRVWTKSWYEKKVCGLGIYFSKNWQWLMMLMLHCVDIFTILEHFSKQNLSEKCLKTVNIWLEGVNFKCNRLFRLWFDYFMMDLN